EMIGWGLIFLSLSIGTGFVFIKDTSLPGLMHHMVITFSAWVVFSVLMWGRFQLGWRGAIASRWTLSGFVLLALGYFGSKIVLEIILGR
ncbi:MAG: cytochrome c biogenesis protein CcsA, partial [Gammaproteobacteria bacterium]|nr:cytochrome c biogenesis protein CcsA [Gammaproteobacteria bacterium]